MTNSEYCYECRLYGNDYQYDDDGELVSACTDCPFDDWDELEDMEDD